MVIGTMMQLLQLLASTAGPIGIVLAITYWYVNKLHKELMEVQEKRVTDQQAMVSKLLELNDKWSEAIATQSEVMEAQKYLLGDIKTALSIMSSKR